MVEEECKDHVPGPVQRMLKSFHNEVSDFKINPLKIFLNARDIYVQQQQLYFYPYRVLEMKLHETYKQIEKKGHWLPKIT